MFREKNGTQDSRIQNTAILKCRSKYLLFGATINSILFCRTRKVKATEPPHTRSSLTLQKSSQLVHNLYLLANKPTCLPNTVIHYPLTCWQLRLNSCDLIGLLDKYWMCFPMPVDCRRTERSLPRFAFSYSSY